MPSVADLGKLVRAKYPDAYKDLSDEDLGKAVQTKYPDAYKDFTPAEAPAAAGDDLSTKVRKFFDPTYPHPGADIGDVGRQAAKGASIALPMALGMGPVTGGALGGALGGVSGIDTNKSVYENAKNVALDTLGGGLLGGVFKGIGAIGKYALPRAQRMALKVLKPTAEEVGQIEKSFVSLEDAGQAIHEAGADRPGLSLRQRRDLLQEYGKQAGNKIDDIIGKAQEQGATVDKASMMDKIIESYHDIFSKPGTVRTIDTEAGPITRYVTPDLRRGASVAEHQIDAIGQTLGPEATLQEVENAKRAVQNAADYHTRGYVGTKAIAQDPGAKFLRGAARALKEAPEEAISAVDPQLGEAFKAAKSQSATAQAFAPIAARAANVKFAGSPLGGVPEHGWSSRSLAFHTAVDPVLDPLRPWLIPVNRGFQRVYDFLPEGAGATSASNLAAYLRSKYPKEDDSAP